MKKILLLLFMCIFCVSGIAYASEYTLKNGMDVLIKKDTRFPLVSIRIAVRTGSVQEKPEVYGIAHVLEHMVFKRSEKWQKNGELAKMIEAAGGYFNAMTSFDYTTYIVDLPNDKWKVGLEVLEQMLFHPLFDAQELEKEKKVVIEELYRGEDEPFSRLFKKTQGVLLKGTPYAHPIIGTEKTINAVTVAAIKDYVKQNYQPQNMAITVVGNVDENAVKSDIASRFSQYQNERILEKPAPIDIATLPYGQFISIEYAAVNQAYMMLALPMPGELTVASTSLDVLSSALAENLLAPLLKKYKYDAKLINEFFVEPYAFRDIGLLFIVAELDAMNVEKFVTTLLQDLKNLPQQQYSEENLQFIKNQTRDALVQRSATYARLASYLSSAQIRGVNPTIETENILAIVDAMNASALQAVAKEWIRPERLMLSGVLPPRSPRPNYVELLKKYWPAPKDTQQSSPTASENTKAEVLALGKGRKIVLLPDSSLPYTAINVSYKGGSSLNTKDDEGLANLAATLLLRGTKELSIFDIEKFLAEHSTSVSVNAGKTSFVIATQQPARYTKDVLEFLKKIITTPSFQEQELDKARTEQIMTLRSLQDRPSSLLAQKLYPLLFPNQLYGMNVLGSENTLKNIKRNAVQDYWKKQRAQEMVVSVAGVFDKDLIIDFVKSLPVFEEKEALQLPKPVWGTTYTETVPLPGRSQLHFMLTYPTAPIKSEDTPTLALLESILNGLSGLLFRELREEHALAYTVRASNRQTTQYGFMSFYIGTSSEDQKLVVSRFQDVIQKLITTPLDDELIERGKRAIEGKYYRAIQEYGTRASSAADSVLDGLPVDFDLTLVKKIRELTAQDVQAVAKKYLTNKNPYLLTIRP